MSIAAYVLAAVGTIVVLAAAIAIAQEVWRAARQALRTSTAAVRSAERRRRPSFREWQFAFRREFLGGYYDSVLIGPFEVPRDPSLPIRRRRRWGW